MGEEETKKNEPEERGIKCQRGSSALDCDAGFLGLQLIHLRTSHNFVDFGFLINKIRDWTGWLLFVVIKISYL